MSKIGRNDACPCGSEKKYKKCCLSRSEILLPEESNIKPAKRMLVTTLTKELFQPMRLYYIIHDKQRLTTSFKQLKCMQYYEELDNWKIIYTKEAAKIGLKVPPSKVPKEARPLVIATIYIENSTTMIIDVRSIERAVKMIEFIDGHIPKEVAEVTHAAIYNQLITATNADQSGIDVDYDEIFAQNNITVINPEAKIQEQKEIAAQYDDQEERMQVMIQKNEDDAKKPLPKVEKLLVYYYEEGIEPFETKCRMRQMIATQHYLGNEDFSFYDLVHGLVHNNMDELQAEGAGELMGTSI